LTLLGFDQTNIVSSLIVPLILVDLAEFQGNPNSAALTIYK